VKQWNTWNENGTEILKITRIFPKVNKSGLKRAAEPVNSAKQKYREVIIADRYLFW
jgi:hypothetical protein